MRLKQLLRSVPFDQIKVLNGEGDWNPNIVTVKVVDQPLDGAHFVKGALIIINAAALMGTAKLSIQFIDKLQQQMVAALGIQGSLADPLKQLILQAADHYHLPVLALPADTGGSVVHQLDTTILTYQNNQLTQIMNDNLVVSKYILARQPDNEILNQIARVMHLDLFIIDSFGRLKARNKQAVINAQLFDYTTHDLDLINVLAPIVIFDRYTLYPLKTTDQLTRRFVILDLIVDHDSAQNLLVSNMVNLLSLESLQVKMNLINDRQRKSEIFETIIAHPIPPIALASILKLNGLAANDDYQSFAVDEANSLNTGNHQFIMHRVADYLYWYFARVETPIILVNWHFTIFGLIKSTPTLAELLKDLNRFLMRQFPNDQHLIGFTATAQPLLNFKPLMDEANQGLTIAKQTRRTPSQFSPLQVDDVLHLIPKEEALIFIHNTFGPLLKLKEIEQAQCLDLLMKFFASNESISKAAAQLFIHRNTAFYRLKKIEKTLNLDLNNVKDNATIRLALQLYAIYDYGDE